MKIKVSEIFYSLQGEGRFVGVPSVFLRTYGCNFTCSGFGCKPGEKSTGADEVAKTVELYKDFLELPLVETGCDKLNGFKQKKLNLFKNKIKKKHSSEWFRSTDL